MTTPGIREAFPMGTSRLVVVTVSVLFLASVGFGTAAGATRGIWISPQEIQALPMSGSAWDNVHNAATSNWGTPNLTDQTVYHAAHCVAGALVWARTGDPQMRAKVRDGIIAAKRTLDEDSEYDCCGSSTPEQNTRVLALARQLAGYVIAADIIDLPDYDPAANAEFSPWLAQIRTRNLPQSSYVQELTSAHEHHANNWCTWAGASRIAASLYLGDTADVARAALIVQAWCGDRGVYPSDLNGQGGYFTRTSAWQASWACGTAQTWTAVNSASADPPCEQSGHSLDGALVEDISRSGGFSWPPGSTAMMYSWEALGGIFMQAEMLHRVGYDSYNWGNQALRRAMDFMVRAGYQLVYTEHRWIPWIANERYGTNYPTPTPIGCSYPMGWTDWTHSGTTPPVDQTPPAAIGDLRSP